MTCLAAELTALRAEAAKLDKSFDLIVRFGSEMNDVSGTSYAQDPKDYIEAFRAVRQLFPPASAGVRFPFSPALRADIDVAEIARYWPGDDAVDMVGATWFVHGVDQMKLGFDNVRDYYLEFKSKGKPFSLDEFGGAMGRHRVYAHNDLMLQPMFEQIAALAEREITFLYATLFLDESQYGVDATLDFLRPDI